MIGAATAWCTRLATPEAPRYVLVAQPLVAESSLQQPTAFWCWRRLGGNECESARCGGTIHPKYCNSHARPRPCTRQHVAAYTRHSPSTSPPPLTSSPHDTRHPSSLLTDHSRSIVFMHTRVPPHREHSAPRPARTRPKIIQERSLSAPRRAHTARASCAAAAAVVLRAPSTLRAQMATSRCAQSACIWPLTSVASAPRVLC